MWWLAQGQNAAAVQAVAALGQGLLTVCALFITIYLPSRQRADEKKLDGERTARELQHLRTALREEVLQISMQSLKAYEFWVNGEIDSARSLYLPSPFILVSNAAQIGRLSREEIVPLVGFAGSIADIRTFSENLEGYVASEEFQRGIKQISNSARISGDGLLRSICRNAAQFLRATPAKPQGKLLDRYEDVIGQLSEAGKLPDGAPTS